LNNLLIALLAFGLLASTAVQAKPLNVLLICVDDLRPELKSFGADYIRSPHIDRLADSGRSFHRHYVNAPSCGPSRYTLLTGRYGPADNNALFKRAKRRANNPDTVTPTMPEWFRKHGYESGSENTGMFRFPSERFRIIPEGWEVVTGVIPR